MHELIAKAVFREMWNRAIRLNVAKGASACYSKESGRIYFELLPEYFRLPDPAKGIGDKGSNYLGVALGKIAQSIRTEKPSKQYEALGGESSYRGSLVSKDGRLIVAFSGGSQDQDVEIAQAGIEVYERSLTEEKIEEIFGPRIIPDYKD